MLPKGKAENELLGENHVKKQKGEKSLYDGVEDNFYKGLVACESRWRLLVFWVSHPLEKTTR